MSLKQITNQCQLTYHQVASCVTALRMKGYVRRVERGFYEVTEEAKLMQLSPDAQIKILSYRVEELENQIKTLISRLSKSIH